MAVVGRGPFNHATSVLTPGESFECGKLFGEVVLNRASFCDAESRLWRKRQEKPAVLKRDHPFGQWRVRRLASEAVKDAISSSALLGFKM